jgi:hypothetical protein
MHSPVNARARDAAPAGCVSGSLTMLGQVCDMNRASIADLIVARLKPELERLEREFLRARFSTCCRPSSQARSTAASRPPTG